MKKTILLLGFLTVFTTLFAGITISRYEDCPRCDGTGRVETAEGKDLCSRCDGSGRIKIRVK